VVAADFSTGLVDAPLYIDVYGEEVAGNVAAVLADPLLGQTRMMRSTTPFTGPQGQPVQIVNWSGFSDDFWVTVAVRPWEVLTAGTIPVVNARNGGTDLFRLVLDEVNETVRAEVDVSGSVRTLNFGALTDFWPNFDASAMPATTDFVPVLIHYVAAAGGAGTGTFAVTLGSTTLSTTHDAAAVPNNLAAGIWRASPAPGGHRTIDTTEIAIYSTDPRSV
jgi:hypothetical protein